jgi:hypothetical protein
MKAKIETCLFKIEVETDGMLEGAVFEKVESLLRLLSENSVIVVKDTEALNDLGRAEKES